MKILVTGHRGFIGSNLYKRLKELGQDVVGLDLKDGQDIRTYNFTEKYDIIYHLAANASIPESFKNPLEITSHNVAGTLRLLEHAKRCGARFVFSSSAAVYDLSSPYGCSKAASEVYMKYYWSAGVKCCALRYFNVFGEGQELANGGYVLALSIFLKQYKNKEPFSVVWNGEQRRDFVYVGDVIEANLKAAEFLKTAQSFESIDIGTGKNYSVFDVVNMINKDHPRVFLSPRVEPFENRANTKKASQYLNWEAKTSIESWIQTQLL